MNPGGDREGKALPRAEAGGAQAATPLHAERDTITLTSDAERAGSVLPEACQGQAVGSYRILREVGHGGMGAVFLAVRDDDEFRKHVAVKLLRRGMDSDAVVRRFRHERQILASIDHPNIAKLLDGGTTDEGLPYFLMEYVDGQPIDRYCDSHNLSVRERLELFRTVCGAVHFAHQNLVVHRDLKPANVLVTADGVPKLLDFGIAKLLRPELYSTTAEATRVEDRVMTPEYASPEQIRGEPITTASDVYSLGVLLYELLTGHHPYSTKGRALHEVTRAICEDDPRRPSTVIREVEERPRADGTSQRLTPESVSRVREGHPDKLRRCLEGDLDDIVMMAMRKEPQRRYASAEQLSEDIRRHLEARPVIARKGTFSYNASKFVRRHRVGVAMAAAAAVLLIGVSVVLAVQAARIARARDRAEREAAKARAVTDFLQDTLASADPYEGQGRDVTVVEFLEAAAKETGPRFADQPEIDAAIRHVIGATYTNLGRYEEAESWLHEALEARRRLLGSEHLDTAETEGALAALLRLKGDYEAAERYSREALAVQRKLAGDETIAVADSLEGLCLTLRQRGDLDTALSLCRQSLAMRRRLLGSEHRDVAMGLDNVGNLLKAKGSYEEAERAYREALAMDRKLLGDGHPAVTVHLNNLGQMLSEVGRHEEAEPLLREALTLERKRLGSEHPAVATTINNIAIAVYGRGDYETAGQLFREALAIDRRLRGDRNPYVATRMDNLGVVLGKTGDYREAERLHRDALAIRRELFGDEHPDVAHSLRNLARALEEQGDYGAAERFYRQALAMYRKLLGDTHPEVGTSLARYGSFLTRLKRYDDAEKHLLESLDLLKTALGEQHAQTQRTLTSVVELYRAWGRPEKAAQYRALLPRPDSR